ncbi:MAG: hypothetical protein Q8K75_01790 [Chlamydiales bacterium]|nr:hypothetical protein [Chlamydiales bacterium]
MDDLNNQAIVPYNAGAAGANNQLALRQSAEFDDWVICDNSLQPVLHQASRISLKIGDLTRLCLEQLTYTLKELASDLSKINDNATIAELHTDLIPAFAHLQLIADEGANAPARCAPFVQAVNGVLIQMQATAPYLSSSLFQLTSMASLAQNICAGEGFDKKSCLTLNSEKALAISTIDTAKNQEPVLEHLDALEIALQDSNVLRHLTNEQLLQLQLVCGWMMVQYIGHQKTNIDLIEHVADKLFEVNNTVNTVLVSRAEQGPVVADAGLKAAFATLQGRIRSNYFPTFWTSPEHHQRLAEVQDIMAKGLEMTFKQSHENLEGMIFLGSRDGISLFEVPQQGDKPKQFAAYFYGRDSVKSHYNAFQGRSGIDFKLGGNCWNPVLQGATETKDALASLIAEQNAQNNACAELVTFGFGIDGAIGQVLAHDLSQKGVKTTSLCVGSAPYLDVNAARTVGKQENHYAMNLKLDQDCLGKGASSLNKLAKEYRESNFHAQYPLYFRDWYAGDIWNRGHNVEVYATSLNSYAKQPEKLAQLHDQVSRLRA